MSRKKKAHGNYTLVLFFMMVMGTIILSPFILIRRLWIANHYKKMLIDLQYTGTSVNKNRIRNFIQLELGKLTFWRVFFKLSKVKKRLEKIS